MDDNKMNLLAAVISLVSSIISIIAVFIRRK